MHLKPAPWHKEIKEALNEESSWNMKLESSFNVIFVLNIYEISCVKAQR